jgi:hypothetical protein
MNGGLISMFVIVSVCVMRTHRLKRGVERAFETSCV